MTPLTPEQRARLREEIEEINDGLTEIARRYDHLRVAASFPEATDSYLTITASVGRLAKDRLAELELTLACLRWAVHQPAGERHVRIRSARYHPGLVD